MKLLVSWLAGFVAIMAAPDGWPVYGYFGLAVVAAGVVFGVWKLLERR